MDIDPANILLIEDERGMRTTLAGNLEDQGYRVIACQSGKEGVERIQQTLPDVVIADLRLPDLSGLDLLGALKEIKPEASFILVTGHASVETAVEALNEGAFAYITKPFNMDEVYTIIRNALKQQRLLLENQRLVEILQQSNGELAREVDERQRTEQELQKAREVALAASRAKSDFLASMSHEIRTPMNAIIGMADVLSETPLTPEQQEYVRVFRTAGETLLDIINDILDLSKVEAGQLVLEQIEFNLVEVVENTIEVFAVRAHAKGIELNCRINPTLPTAMIGDPMRLRQVISNLLSNAIKFTSQGEVNLYIDNCSPSGEPGHLLFRVSDTGIGISRGKADSIFDSFTQADSSTTREYGGTGLGLAICRRLVEMMEGRIWAESEAGEGSDFNFSARLQTPAPPGESRPLPCGNIKGLKVLVVDDNHTNRLILSELLSTWGAAATVVADGALALAELDRARREQDPYRLLLLDHRMPGCDGFAAVQRVPEQPGLAEMTIMMLASDNRTKDVARCRELGISRYLIKPVKQRDLFQAITASPGLGGSPTPETAAAATPAGPVDRRPLRILLVEDSPANCLVIQSYFKRTLYRIDVAENGEVAVEMFESGDYHLVLMDMQMPVMDGYTATRLIRKWEANQGGRPIPIISLTANALKEDKQKSLDAGCTTHITKPVKKAPLLEAILELTRGVPCEAAPVR